VTEKEPGVWEYNWANLALRNINTDLLLQVGGGRKLTTFLFCKYIVVAKSKEVKTG
jgi:hypothetical protein